MIDARQWTRPPAAEIRAKIKALPMTVQEVGQLLGRSRRRVFYWMSGEKPIDYVEYLALQALVNEVLDGKPVKVASEARKGVGISRRP